MYRVHIADIRCQLRHLWLRHAALRPAQVLSGWSWMQRWNSREPGPRCALLPGKAFASRPRPV